MKKFVELFVVVGLVLSVLASSVAFAGFTDVTSDDFYYDAVSFLQDEGVVSGYSDGSFGYGLEINRAELLAIVIKAMDQSKLPGSSQWNVYAVQNCFSDVPASQWYTKYVCYAEEQGWVAGYPDGSFRPEEPVNFVEALRISMSGLGFDFSAGTTPWYKGLVDSASEKNLIPLTIHSFDQKITRGEMADLVARSLKKKAGKLDDWLGDKKGYEPTYGSISAGISKYKAYFKDPTCIEPEDVPNKYGCHPSMYCDAGEVCREGVCVDEVDAPNEYGCNPLMYCDAGEVCRDGLCVDEADAPNEYGCHPSMYCDEGEMCMDGLCYSICK